MIRCKVERVERGKQTNKQSQSNKKRSLTSLIAYLGLALQSRKLARVSRKQEEQQVPFNTQDLSPESDNLDEAEDVRGGSQGISALSNPHPPRPTRWGSHPSFSTPELKNYKKKMLSSPSSPTPLTDPYLLGPRGHLAQKRPTGAHQLWNPCCFQSPL